MTYTKSKGPAPQPYNPRALPPPELPPRAISPSTTVSSSWHGGGGQPEQGPNQETSPPRHNDQNVAGNPLGRSHSAVMTSNIRMYTRGGYESSEFCFKRLIRKEGYGREKHLNNLITEN